MPQKNEEKQPFMCSLSAIFVLIPTESSHFICVAIIFLNRKMPEMPEDGGNHLISAGKGILQLFKSSFLWNS